MTPSPAIVAAGVALGVIYTLSPMLVWFALALVVGHRWLVRGLPDDERRMIVTVFALATLARGVVIAVLFATTDHDTRSFASLFGDEEYFKYRSMWLRSVALGVSVHPADMIYAFSEYSETNYLYAMGFLQVLVGEAPYGVHLFSILAFLAASVLLFRFVRERFGPPVALLTAVATLFLPSLFAWSVSALRESVHLLLTLLALIAAIRVIEAPSWRRRLAAGLVSAAALFALRDLRAGSMLASLTALAIAFALLPLVRRSRVLVGVAVLAVVMAGIAASRPAVQSALLERLRGLALQHHGHVYTPGYSYRVLDDHFYGSRSLDSTSRMTWPEAGRYVVRALVAVVLVPLPWEARSRFELVYVPEQMIWYLALLLAPIGFVAAYRINPRAALVFAAYIACIGAGIALSSGNIGTLVRHRGLVLPFLFCFAAVAICRLLARRTPAAHPETAAWPPRQRTFATWP